MVVAHTAPNMDRVVHDFSRNPLLVYWEMTQACGLAAHRGDALGSDPLCPYEPSTAIPALA